MCYESLEFENLGHARACGAAWREDYNDYRPRSSLGSLPHRNLRVAVVLPSPLLA
jgi:transposase InsO family protein